MMNTSLVTDLAPADLTEVETLLPASVKALVAVLGLHDACDLVRAVGGTTLWIPVCRTRAGEACFEYLAERVGVRAAEKLVATFGGEVFYVPRCEAALTEIAYRQIRRDFDVATANGQSSVQAVAGLAVRFGYSDRHVWSILKMADRTVDALADKPADPRQQRLCD